MCRGSAARDTVMDLLESISDLARVSGPVHLGIGVFDGVHLGHQAVIQSASDSVRMHGGSAVVVTFDPHPMRVLRPDLAPRLLTSTAHKIRLIAQLDVPFLLKICFDENFAALEAGDFVDRLVASSNPLRTISVGNDWSFGKGRRGNVEMLKCEGTRSGFDVLQVPAVCIAGEPVSSTRIRNAVESGDLSLATSCLGRRFSILGTVVRGDQLGRTIGFPTANLRAHNEQFPPNGVYIVRSMWEGQHLAGVANIGLRPTVAQVTPERRLEVHFLDFSRDLYDQDVEIEFIDHLRDERRFDGLEALKTQIALDVAQARTKLTM